MNDLVEIAKRPDQRLVRHLERLLESAKSGDLQGIINVDLLSGERTTYKWYARNTHEQASVIGCLFSLMTALSNNSEGMFTDIKRLKELLGE